MKKEPTVMKWKKMFSSHVLEDDGHATGVDMHYIRAPGHQGIDICYAGGFAFFLVSTIKMRTRQLLWQLQLGEHLKRNATMLNTSLCIFQAGSYHSPSTLRCDRYPCSLAQKFVNNSIYCIIDFTI
ncbi:hypothetical protein HN51_021011 [Arachis hypogaea]